MGFMSKLKDLANKVMDSDSESEAEAPPAPDRKVFAHYMVCTP